MTDGTLRIVNFNVHVNLAVSGGGTTWLVQHYHPDIFTLQEVIKAKPLRAKHPHYHCLPVSHPNQIGTYVLAKKDRFTVLRVENPDVTYGGEFPRRRTVAVLRDKVTGRVLVVGDIHAQPDGKRFRPSRRTARAVRQAQFHSYANRMKAVPGNRAAFCAGDFNTWLKSPRSPAVKEMATARMVPTYKVKGGRVRIDEIFFRPSTFLKLTRRAMLKVPTSGDDHDAILADFALKGFS